MNSIIDKLIIKLSYFSFICEMVGVWTFHILAISQIGHFIVMTCLS